MWSVGEVVCVTDMYNAGLNHFPGAVKIMKGLKSLHPSVECWREVVCVPDMDNGGLNFFLEL